MSDAITTEMHAVIVETAILRVNNCAIIRIAECIHRMELDTFSALQPIQAHAFVSGAPQIFASIHAQSVVVFARQFCARDRLSDVEGNVGWRLTAHSVVANCSFF
jgi:hypothetical protein